MFAGTRLRVLEAVQVVLLGDTAPRGILEGSWSSDLAWVGDRQVRDDAELGPIALGVSLG